MKKDSRERGTGSGEACTEEAREEIRESQAYVYAWVVGEKIGEGCAYVRDREEGKDRATAERIRAAL